MIPLAQKLICVLVVDQYAHGQLNPTYLIELQSGPLVKKYVLRKKPPGQLLQSAHAVEREFQVITVYICISLRIFCHECDLSNIYYYTL